MPIRLETTQYRASPLGNEKVRNASMRGIIHNSMLLVEACLASVVGIIVIFCWTHVEAPTSSGIMMGEGSGSPRFIHKKSAFSGTIVSDRGFHEYSLWDRPTRWSGLVPRLLIRA